MVQVTTILSLNFLHLKYYGVMPTLLKCWYKVSHRLLHLSVSERDGYCQQTEEGSAIIHMVRNSTFKGWTEQEADEDAFVPWMGITILCPWTLRLRPHLQTLRAKLHSSLVLLLWKHWLMWDPSCEFNISVSKSPTIRHRFCLCWRDGPAHLEKVRGMW